MTTTTTASRTLTGIRVNTDGTLEDVRIEVTGERPAFVGITGAVGCDVFDVVGLPDGIDVFVDDEGLYRASYNPVLSDIVGRKLHAPVDYRLHGAGVFLAVDDDGDTLSLTPAQRGTVASAWFSASPLVAL